MGTGKRPRRQKTGNYTTETVTDFLLDPVVESRSKLDSVKEPFMAGGMGRAAARAKARQKPREIKNQLHSANSNIETP